MKHIQDLSMCVHVEICASFPAQYSVIYKWHHRLYIVTLFYWSLHAFCAQKWLIRVHASMKNNQAETCSTTLLCKYSLLFLTGCGSYQTLWKHPSCSYVIWSTVNHKTTLHNLWSASLIGDYFNVSETNTVEFDFIFFGLLTSVVRLTSVRFV